MIRLQLQYISECSLRLGKPACAVRSHPAGKQFLDAHGIRTGNISFRKRFFGRNARHTQNFTVRPLKSLGSMTSRGMQQSRWQKILK
jgi:hypothetical protein